MIFQDLNDTTILPSQGSVRNGGTKTKKKVKFEQEAASFVQIFKALIKEVGEVSAFMKTQYA